MSKPHHTIRKPRLTGASLILLALVLQHPMLQPLLESVVIALVFANETMEILERSKH